MLLPSMNPAIAQFTLPKALRCFPAVKKKRRAAPFLTSWCFFLKYRINLKLIFHICQFQPQLQLFPYARTKFKITVCIFGLSEMQTEAKFASQAAASCLPGIDDARVHPGPG